MPMLQVGSEGPRVETLQQKLADLNFSPGPIDGIYGPATEAAVLAFQRSQGLIADGIAGPKTLSALGLDFADDLREAVSEVDVITASRMLPGAPHDNIEKYLPHVLEALEEVDLNDKAMVLMALATIRAETERFEPINEYRSRYNTSPGGHPFDLYDHREDLGNEGPPDGERYRGRGFIQLTGKYNYRKFGEAIGLGDELVENPERANDPEIAARLLAHFLKSRERRIREAIVDGNLVTARRLVNGGRHGLDRFRSAFRTGQQLIQA